MKRVVALKFNAVALMAVSCVALCQSAYALPQYDPQDPIDLNFGVLEALERVERACICHEGDGEADRRRTLRLLNDLDWRRNREGNYVRLGDWARKGVGGGQRGFQFACAKLFHLAGVLYGYPEYVATGRSLEAMFLAEGPETAFRAVAALPPPVRRYYELMSESHEDLNNEIRPGGRGGSPFWNGNALVFIYPPAFDFKRVAGAVSYRFDVLDDRHVVHSFTSAEPTASLKPVWQQVPVGFTTVECTALAADGGEIGAAGRRTFWRNTPFDPAQYAPAKRSYGEACALALDYLFRWPDLKYLEEHGEPDVSKETNFTSYPSKMLSAVIHVMLRVAESFPDRRERALRIARIAAAYLLRNRAPDSSPLAGFTPTYASKGQRADDFGGQHMLIYPAQAGSAFLALHAATKDGELLAAARKIAQTYLRLQDKDGTWYLKMNEKDGSPVSGNRLVPTGVIDFLEEIYAATGEEEYRAAGDRAFAFIDRGPLTDWNWEGQFEDINPSAHRYQNLTKHNACETAIYLVKRFPGDRRRIAQARDILRYAEDQFVMWRSPCRSDGTGPWTPVYPFNSWRTPTVLEQYDCYSPIDASAAKLIRTYLALYAAEGKALDLAKARALGDSTVNNQDASGRIRTYWIPEAGDDDPLAGTIRLPYGGDWYNCMAADISALTMLSSCVKGCAASQECKKGQMKLACQMWGVKEFWEKDPEKGFAEVFPRVKAMGYEGVQSMAFWNIDQDRLEALLKENGLALADMPINFDHVEGTNVERTVAFCRRFDIGFLYIPWFDGKSADEWRDFCARLNAAGKRLAPYGIKVGYHNHVHEFTKPLNGEYPADILKADRNVNLELDIGPVTESGNDAVKWIMDLSGRIPGMHAKPHGASAAGAPGDVQDWPKIVAAARKAGVKWFVVECEKRKDTYDDVAASAAYLKPLLESR